MSSKDKLLFYGNMIFLLREGWDDLEERRSQCSETLLWGWSDLGFLWKPPPCMTVVSVQIDFFFGKKKNKGSHIA